jgi:hypothetical protein
MALPLKESAMSTCRTRKSLAIANQASQLAFAVPQVILQRTANLAAATSARDGAEFTRMITEKQRAFSQAWLAMGVRSLVGGQALFASMLRSAWAPWFGKPWQAPPLAAQASNVALDVLHAGFAPVHRTAVANARRLGRSRATTRQRAR